MNEAFVCGKRIKQCMDEKGWNQTDLYEKLIPICERHGISLSRASLSYYMSGKRLPRHNVIACLSELFNVDVTWLWGLNETVSEQKLNSLGADKVVEMENNNMKEIEKHFGKQEVQILDLQRFSNEPSFSIEELNELLRRTQQLATLPKEKRKLIYDMIDNLVK